MIIYNYDETTKEYTGVSQADLNPVATKREGRKIYMLPANATEQEPPKTKEHEAVIFENNDWEIIDDFRGMYEVNSELKPALINELGSLKAGYIAITKAQADKILEDPLFYVFQNNELVINPNYAKLKLQQAKENKLNEATKKAESFIENDACYHFDENNSIEAKDTNIGKLTAYMLGFQAGIYEKVEWTSKENKVIELDENTLFTVLTGMGAIQSHIWNVQFVGYTEQIENAQSVEEVNAINIVYTDNIESEE